MKSFIDSLKEMLKQFDKNKVTFEEIVETIKNAVYGYIGRSIMSIVTMAVISIVLTCGVVYVTTIMSNNRIITEYEKTISDKMDKKVILNEKEKELADLERKKKDYEVQIEVLESSINKTPDNKYFEGNVSKSLITQEIVREIFGYNSFLSDGLYPSLEECGYEYRLKVIKDYFKDSSGCPMPQEKWFYDISKAEEDGNNFFVYIPAITDANVRVAYVAEALDTREEVMLDTNVLKINPEFNDVNFIIGVTSSDKEEEYFALLVAPDE